MRAGIPEVLMSWSAITATHVAQRLVNAELLKLSAYLAESQTDPVPEEIADAVAEIRGDLATGGYSLGAADTLPPALKSTALAIIVFRICTRLPDVALINDNRRRLYDDALKKLEQVRDGKAGIEDPDSDAPVTAGPSVEQPGAPTRIVTRETMSGL